MIAVLGSFRLPQERCAEALPLMQAVIEATLREPGCLAYSYAEDLSEPGLFRVMELWADRAALTAHFETPHMRQWSEQRAQLGFMDRDVRAHVLASTEQL
jgi:quinol monooxygenase YgiN